MKGLLIKDFRLIKNQKTFFILVIVLAVLMTFLNNDITFLIGYTVFVIPMFSLNTISYDEFENGYAFLFTLPISRKIYVIEKYVLSLILGLIAWVISFVISLIYGTINDYNPIYEILTATPIIFSIMLIILSVMITIQIKFGSNKNIVIMLVAGATVFAGIFLGQFIGFFDIDGYSQLIDLIFLNIGTVIAVFSAVAVLVTLLSLKISISILSKKEF